MILNNIKFKKSKEKNMVSMNYTIDISKKEMSYILKKYNRKIFTIKLLNKFIFNAVKDYLKRRKDD